MSDLTQGGRMRTANELYEMPHQSATNNLSDVAEFFYNHVGESGVDLYSLPDVNDGRVEIRVLEFVNFDGRRIWQLATVWYLGKPFMILQSAGREGDDHAERFITDEGVFWSCCVYLQSLVDTPHADTINPDIPIAALTTFYGRTLGDNHE